ncbi:MAG: GNAT family N-acetyltransferase [Gloeobacteraceae cyanobacterium ES-bin-316]|nr:GNAT family N-acetyltransferase [Ferruginibacter sp.]
MHFTLRPWMMSDLGSLVHCANNQNVSRFLMNKFPHPYTEEDGKKFIAFATQGNPVNIFTIDIEGKAAGGIGLHPLSDVECKNAEMGYWLAEPYWGNGIVTKAVKQMINYGFETFDINRIFARPFGHNTASQKVLEKVGFVLEAKLEKTFFKNGEYVDEWIYAVRKNDWQKMLAE